MHSKTYLLANISGHVAGAPAGEEEDPNETEINVVEKWFYFPGQYNRTKVLEDRIDKWKSQFSIEIFYPKYPKR